MAKVEKLLIAHEINVTMKEQDHAINSTKLFNDYLIEMIDLSWMITNFKIAKVEKLLIAHELNVTREEQDHAINSAKLLNDYLIEMINLS